MQLARGELPFAYLTLSWNLAQNLTQKPSQAREAKKHDCVEEEQEEGGDEAKQAAASCPGLPTCSVI